ncbi:hypothetical protein FRC12_007124 [Ceratobasidium sp. 428]|nr:hypothetical protein FRC12_007124 [Ceratobasidium sp. 428]
MPAASFDTLPTDLLLAIFSVSTPASVRACWHVCPLFKELISTNDYLQYVLALLACGYVEPLCPRTDLSYAQKKQILKDHLHRWYKNDVVATYHELPTGKGRLVASAKGTTMWAPEGTTGYMFFQNPSNNQGTGLNQRSFYSKINEFSAAVDPDHNLLAILDLRYTIHLLTVTTQERHPKSPAMPIVYNCDAPNMFGTLWGDRIELFGQLLIGVFAMNRRITRSALVIWNWMTGQEIMRVVIKTRDHVRRYMNRIFDFLSEDTIVICRQFDPTETLTQGLPKYTFGLLDIYKFDPLAVSPATLVASLALPANILPGETESPAVYFSSSLYTPPSLRPQVWETTPETRLLCISVDGMFRWENVCVQAQTLLEYADTTSGSIVRWAEWRLQAA